jgi:CDP-glucose 4,6-dehydratase
MSLRSFYSGKRVFVTGHTGFKGAWLSEWLVQMGASVTGYSKDLPTRPSLFQELKLSSRMNDLRGDIRDLLTLQKALTEVKPDIVFHLAAQSLVRSSYDFPVQTFSENLMGSVNLLEALRVYQKAAAAVIVTTDKVYENKNRNRGYKETDQLGGYDPYSASKAAVEIATCSYARSYFRSGTRIATARAGNVIAGGDWAKERLVPDAIRAWASNQKFELRNPSHVRPWEFVLEALSGYLLLAKRLAEGAPGLHGEGFNFGPRESGVSAGDLIELLAENWPSVEFQFPSNPKESFKKESSLLYLNCDKSAHLLGWRPILSLAEAAKLTADWYKAASVDQNNVLVMTQTQILFFEGIFESIIG